MSDRTESLLAELVELQRRQLAIQEEAIAGQRTSLQDQKRSIEIQHDATERQRKALRLLFGVFTLVVVMGFGPYLWAWLRYFTSR